MQTLIPLIVCLGLASGTHLTLVPYAYLVDPLPVYHQSQNTRTGEHAYSYSGGPSAKEEVKGLDGVTRGSYSYIDANGLLQSVFYVADEAGFRVAATNLPTSNDIPSEPEQVVLAKLTHQEAHTKASSSRKKRSLEDPTPKQQDTSSGAPEKTKEDSKMDQVQSESSLVPVTSVSHQSRVDIHRNLRLEPLESGKVLEIPVSPVYTPSLPVAIPAAVPLATSHQSKVQIHGNVRLAVPEAKEAIKVEPLVAVQSPVAVATIGRYQSGIPILETVEPHYQDARIQYHKSLGIEGPNPKDTVKIEQEPVTIVEPVISSVRSSPILTKEVVAIPSIPAVATVPQIITAYSSQSRSQIHQNSKLKLDTIPESVQVEASPVLSYVQPISAIPLIGSIPIAQSSQYQSQIRFNQKLEPVNLAVQTDA